MAYTGSLGIYKCPSDPSTVTINGLRYPLVRSYSLNGRLNGGDWGLSPIDEFNNPAKLSAIYAPGPSERFAFMDERADSIDDGYFGVDMVDSGSGAMLVNIPANYHLGRSAISFADGHSEIHTWRDARTEPSMQPNSYLPNGAYSVPNDLDIAWLQTHGTSQR